MTDDTSKGIGPIAVLYVGLLATLIIGGAFIHLREGRGRGLN